MQLLPAETSGNLIGSVHLADCLELCERVYRAGVRVDMILADLPYGTTACAWDTIIPFEPMWKAFKRIIKPRGAIVLTASQPFTSALVMSNPKMYRHAWVWNKSQSGSFQNAKHQPLKITEDVLVFGVESVNYFPEMMRRNKRIKSGNKGSDVASGLGANMSYVSDMYHPTNILSYPNCANKADNQHPTQKPTDLFSYLIRTYTQPDELIFDPCVGSGTTALAATIEKRRFICGDSDPGYVDIARDRLRMYGGDVSDLPLFAARPA